MYISRITINLDTHAKLTFQDFHNLLNVACPGLQLDRDIITNPNQASGFYVTGVNPRAARAIADQAHHYNLEVVRLDLCFTEIVRPELIDRAETISYNYQVGRLKKHLNTKKYQGGTRDFTRFDVRHFTMGGDKAIKQLEITDHTEAPSPIEALQIIWRLRNEWAKEAWMIILKSSDLQQGVDNAFAAATNSFLGPDWFNLSHNQELRLLKTAREIVKKEVVLDWRLLLDQVIEARGSLDDSTDCYDWAADINQYVSRSLGIE